MLNMLILTLIIFSFTSYSHTELYHEINPSCEKVDLRDIKIIQLEMRPDPVHEAQSISFQASIQNQAPLPVRINLYVKERNKIITHLRDIRLYPGYNQIIFPRLNYRFSREEHCFVLEIELKKKKGTEISRKFCARKSHQGWTLLPQWTGPVFVEELEMFPDPAQSGQEIRFKVLLRNEGPTIRANLRVSDKDRSIVELREVLIPAGYSEFYFPQIRFFFQRADHCFAVYVYYEKIPYKANSKRELCARPLGWTLRH